jgi:hypothetical protein
MSKRTPVTELLDDPREMPSYSFAEAAHYLRILVAERYKAGESVNELADDYGCKRRDIEEAVRCELALAA